MPDLTKPDTRILTSDEVAEIEARALQVKELVGVGQFGEDMLALCQTVRAAWARLAQCEGSRRVHELDNHHNAMACGYCAGPLKDELTRLQSQLAQAHDERWYTSQLLTDTQNQLARVTQERDDLRGIAKEEGR